MESAEVESLTFCFLPVGNEEIASSRLRCYRLSEGLQRRGVRCMLGYQENCNILVIQKKTDAVALAAAFDCKRKDRTLIFDIDDFYDDRSFQKSVQTIISLADVVTTATLEQKELVSRFFSCVPHSKVFSLPNPVDYGLTQPKQRVHLSTRTLKVVWFGNVENFPDRVAALLGSLDTFEFHAITNATSELRGQFPGCIFHEWSYSDFIAKVASFDVCILDHRGSDVVMAKSANKMVAAIALGIPVIASRTPDYRRVARLGGIEEWLYEDDREIVECLHRAQDPSLRNAYLERAQQKLWSEFSIDCLVPTFLEIAAQAHLLARENSGLLHTLKRRYMEVRCRIL